jgi:hypothetical protein
VFAGEDAVRRAPRDGKPTDAEGDAPLFAEEPVAGSGPARRVPSTEESPLFADEADLSWSKRWWWSSRSAAPMLLLGAVLFIITLGVFLRNAPLLRPPNPDVPPADTSIPLSQPNVPARPAPRSPAAEDEPIPVTAQRDVPADVSPSTGPVPSPAGDPLTSPRETPPTSPREDPPTSPREVPPASPREDPLGLPALAGIPAIAGTTIPIAPPPYSREPTTAPRGAEPTTETAAAPADETAAVREVLGKYVDAYAALDAWGVAAVWPTVDEPALEKAFWALQSQSISFSRCTVTVSGATARALCAGTVVWTPKVGGARSREDERTWTFSLTQRGDSWAIVSVEVR